MQTIHARSALLPDGWSQDVRIDIDGGVIVGVHPGCEARLQDERAAVLVAGMPNLHSHAFQRAMAGLAETRGPAADSFWSWRTTMYDFALKLSPGQVEAVAAHLYMEMLEAGFTHVGEFHYLHHDHDGGHYTNIAEMAERICAASSEAGIGLTLLPVFYAHSNFGGAPPTDGQRRFINSIDSFERLMEACGSAVSALDAAKLGIAPHSLRAVTPEELTQLMQLHPNGPIHVHVGEQTREVEDCLSVLSARPVEWLLANAPVNDRWCLIHATHMTPQETQRMARTGAVAGLCPITEANLGDGTFPGPAFLDAGGRFGIGSDSNVLISLPTELRQLEYSQRLALRSRNVIAEPSRSTGRALFERAVAGGGQALAVQHGIAAGSAANVVALDAGAVAYLEADQILDNWIFAQGVTVDSVWVRGKKRVEQGRHLRHAEIAGRFAAAMVDLLADRS